MSPGAGVVRVSDLRVEHRVEPLGVDVVPRFSWAVESDRPDCTLQGHHIVLRADGDVVWESRTAREYSGAPLAPLTHHDWTLRVETDHGAAEAESWFVTGPGPDDWSGSNWIGRVDDGARPPAPLLRTGFDLTGGILEALLVVAAGGYADVTINGAAVADEVLSPGFTDYTRRAQYVVHDVTALLRPGANAIGAELGRGFYGLTGANTWDWHTAPWHGEPCLRLLLVVRHTDGRTTRVTSGPGWRTAGGPTRSDDVYAGEDHDARLRQPGFDRPGFDDGAWRPVDLLAGPAGRLEWQRQQPIRIVERLPVEEVTEPEPGVYVIRVSRVVAGWLQVRARGAAGSQITLRYGERLTAEGRPNVTDDRGYFAGRLQTDRFVLAGTGEVESWHARFSWKGFQYVEITGWPGPAAPRPSDITAHVVHTDVSTTGSFACSEPRLQRLHEITMATIRNNLHGIPTDTPKYEKNGWTGDGMVGAEMFLRNLDTAALLAKWVDDIGDTRPPGGAPQVIAPHGGWHVEWSPAPTWHAAYVLIPWWLHRHAADRRVLERHHPAVAEYVRFELARSPGGIADTTLGDWVSPEADPGGGNPPEDRRVAATAYLHAMLAVAARTAALLGHDADAADLRADAARVRDAFRARFLDPASGLVRGEGDAGVRQSHHVLAVALGLLDPPECDRAVEIVAEDVRARGTHLNTGALATKHLLPVLTDHGHAELALAVALQPQLPGWGLWLEHGATTLWEHWSPESRSRGHYFLGTIDDWLHGYVAGLRLHADDPDLLVVAPALTAHLEWARAETRTRHGRAAVAWRCTGDRLVVDVTVPVGARAQVHVPGCPPETLPAGTHTVIGKPSDGDHQVV